MAEKQSNTRHYRPCVHSLLLLCLIALSACGGGGTGTSSPSTGSGTSGSASGSSPGSASGSSSPTSNNNSYSGATAAAVLTTDTTSLPRMADTIMLALRTEFALGYYLMPRPSPVAGLYSPTLLANCDGGGASSAQGSFAGDGSGTATVQYGNCTSSFGYTANGTMTLQMLAAPGAAHSDLRVTMDSFSVSFDGQQDFVSGTVEQRDVTVDPNSPTIEVTQNLVLTDVTSRKQVNLQNLVFTMPFPSSGVGPNPSTLQGRIYQSDNGYVDVTTETPFQIPNYDVLGGFLTATQPFKGGRIRGQGNASSLWLRPEGADLFALMADTRNVAHPTSSVLLKYQIPFESQFGVAGKGSAHAAAGPSSTPVIGAATMLDGNFSSAQTHKWVTYSWKLMVTPPGSQTALTDPDSPIPSITPDRAGQYLMELTTFDGTSSTTDSLLEYIPLPGDLVTDPQLPNSVAASTFYFGPDLELNVGDAFAPVVDYSTPAFSIGTVSTGLELAFVGPDKQPVTLQPALTLSQPGFYSLFADLTNSQYASQSLSVGAPLRYLKTAAYRALISGTGLAVADLSGQGTKDIIADGQLYSDTFDYTWNLAIYRNTGPQRYAAVQYVPAGNGGTLVAADFNGDGRMDIATESDVGADILLQQSDGSYSTPQPLSMPAPACQAAGSVSHAIVKGDFNHDGRVDVAFRNPCRAAVDVFIQNADGTFTSSEIVLGTNSVAKMLVADVNGDGYDDLVLGESGVSGSDPPQIVVYAGAAGAAGLAGPVTYTFPSSGPNLLAACAGDYNGDGKTDIIALTAGGFYLLAQQGGVLAPARQIGLNPTPAWAGTFFVQFQDVAMTDLDGDGKSDLAAWSPYGPVLAGYLQQADGTLTAPQQLFGQGAGSAAPLFLDLDGDGKTDIVQRSGADVQVIFHRPP